MNKKRQESLRNIPAVNDLLDHKLGAELLKNYSRDLVVETIRVITDELRDQILSVDLEQLDQIGLAESDILKQTAAYLEQKTSDNLLTAVNATGVVIHTNLGRSLLADSAKDKLVEVASKYSTLEINCETGERGSRYELVEDLLVELTGAEAALVVNNNAAAVLIAVSALAEGQEAIIARGQLVEIGGSFRIPDVMEQGGATLKGIGTTNRVHLKDYRNAINDETGMILKVHTSNYKVVGFSKDVALEDLAELGTEHELPVVEDLGSGILVDLTETGLSYEQTVQDTVAAGADVVTFSGDKLLGGPQAGIIVGKEEYIEQMKSHPLNRAMRVDKFTLGALEATLKEYRDFEAAKEKIPTLRMLTASLDDLKAKAESIVEKLDQHSALKVREGISRVGGGSYPTEELRTYVVEIDPQEMAAHELAEQLRHNDPPIFTRITDEKVILDVRTLQQGDQAYLVAALQELL